MAKCVEMVLDFDVIRSQWGWVYRHMVRLADNIGGEVIQGDVTQEWSEKMVPTRFRLSVPSGVARIWGHDPDLFWECLLDGERWPDGVAADTVTAWIGQVWGE